MSATPSPSILKIRDLAESTLSTQELEDAKSHYVFPEKAAAVLKASLQKAQLAARRAAMFGFPEPSIYRDDDDPLGEDESAGEDEDFLLRKETKKSNGAGKPKGKKKKIVIGKRK